MDDQRKRACAKYLIRSNATEDVDHDTLKVKSDQNFPNRSKNIRKFTPIASYVSDIIDERDISTNNIVSNNVLSPIPPWELQQASYNYDYCKVTKQEDPIQLTSKAKEKHSTRYQSCLKKKY